MRQVTGSINTIPVTIQVLETLVEFREGARIFEIKHNNGLLFNFGKPQVLLMENSNVPYDLKVLYFHKFSKYGIVDRVETMKANTYGPYSSIYFYDVCLELSDDFCAKNKIGVGSILTLNDSL